MSYKAGTIEFNAEFMGAGEPLVRSTIPGFGAANRTPETRRKHAVRAKGVRPAESGPKGLARSCVVAERVDATHWNIRVKGTRALLGTIQSFPGKKGRTYRCKPLRAQQGRAGFPSQRAAMAWLLEQC